MARKSKSMVTDVLGIKDAAESKTNTIDAFTFDKEIYQEIYDQSPAIKKNVKEGDQIIRTYPDLAQDIYMSLYKHRPIPTDISEMKETHQFNHQLMQQLMESDDFRRLRANTRLDMIGSALGMEVISNAAVQIIKEYEEQYKQKNEGNSPFDGINNQVDGEGGGDPSVPGQGSGGAAGNGNGQQGSGQGGGMTPEQAQQLAQDMQNFLNGNPLDPNNPQGGRAQSIMNEAVKNALDTVDEVNDFLQAWGMEGGNPNNRITYEDKKRALQRLRKSDKLKELTELVGRMKKLAINEQKQKAPEGAEAIKSVKTGNDITTMLPSERAQLASKNKSIRQNFYRRYHDKELLQYDMDVYESMGKGPMIVLKDTSGSMSGPRIQWASAVGLALLEVATKQKRHYACVHYDSRITGVWEIPFGTLRPEMIFDMAEQFSGGGTNFEFPLRKAMEIMQNSKFKKGDIVFITDGDCSIRPQFLEEFLKLKAEKGFQVHSVLINTGGYGGSDATLKQFSDKVTKLSDLAKMGETTAKDIFRNV